MTHPLIEAREIRKRFGETQALDSVSLQVAPGEVYCLLGANGAGKSTLLNSFLGLVAPDGGSTSIDGIDVTRDPVAARRRIGYIPETVTLYPDLTGIENLEYFARLAGVHDGRRDTLRAALERAGLDSAAMDRPLGSYSKGMRQKVGVAIALVRQARVLLLDEPTSGLDPQASNEFSTLLRQLQTDGIAILMATHDLFRAKELGGRIGILRRGRLLAELSAADVAHSDLERLYLEHMAT